MTHVRLMSGLIITGVLLGFAARAHAQGQTCSDFFLLARSGIPMNVGDTSTMAQLLNPTIATPQLSAAFKRAAALKALGDGGLRRDPSACPQPRPGTSPRGIINPDDNTDAVTQVDCLYRKKKTGSVLQVKLAEGRLKYLNASRRFDVFKGTDNTVPAAQALSTVLNAAVAFGVPRTELDEQQAEIRTLMLAGKDSNQSGRGEVHPAEVHVRFPRQVGGTPVFDSSLQGAVDVNGKVARLHIRWPDFRMAGGGNPDPGDDTISRTEVIQNVVETLGQEHRCFSLSSIQGHIAYVRTREVRTGDGSDEAGGGSPDPIDRFIPALVVYAVPVEPAEDSGDLAQGAQQLTIPLFSNRSD